MSKIVTEEQNLAVLHLSHLSSDDRKYSVHEYVTPDRHGLWEAGARSAGLILVCYETDSGVSNFNLKLIL
jgi:hypothetical protein